MGPAIVIAGELPSVCGMRVVAELASMGPAIVIAGEFGCIALFLAVYAASMGPAIVIAGEARR